MTIADRDVELSSCTVWDCDTHFEGPVHLLKSRLRPSMLSCTLCWKLQKCEGSIESVLLSYRANALRWFLLNTAWYTSAAFRLRKDIPAALNHSVILKIMKYQIVSNLLNPFLSTGNFQDPLILHSTEIAAEKGPWAISSGKLQAQLPPLPTCHHGNDILVFPMGANCWRPIIKRSKR